MGADSRLPAAGSGEPTRALEAASLGAVADRWAAPLIALLAVGLLAADQGGYFPTSWGWAAVLVLWAIALWLLFGARSEAAVLDGTMIGALGLFVGWIALSIVWSDSVSASVRETERAVLYVAALGAALFLLRKGSVHLLAAALLAAIFLVDLYSLCTRLFPDRLGVYDAFSVYRLAEPIGYWNGLGIFTTLGVLLAAGFAARGRSAFVRICAATSLVVLLPVLYFTFSRGAWIALGVGFVCALAYDTRRLQLAASLLMLAPAPAVATILATRADALTHQNVPLADAVHDGHRLAVALLLLAAVAVVWALALELFEPRVRPSRPVRLAFGAGLVALPLIALVVVLVHYGGPSDAISRAYHSFKSPPVLPSNLNKRLLTLTSNGRIDTWRVAWHDYKDHPAVGSGAGTYARYWFRTRPSPAFNAQDAHGLYIETLAELGPVGLALLALALVVPLLAAIRARAEPLAAFLLAAYVAFVLHAGVDWDFELPAVFLAGLLCGAGLIVAARDGSVPRRWSWGLRSGAGTVTLVLIAFALLGLVANSALSSSESARRDHDWVKAENQAHKARRLMPWSPEPLVALGSAQAARGDFARARVSFRRAVGKDRGDWTLWLKLAAVAKGRERSEAVREVRRLNPLSSELAALTRKP